MEVTYVVTLVRDVVRSAGELLVRNGKCVTLKVFFFALNSFWWLDLAMGTCGAGPIQIDFCRNKVFKMQMRAVLKK